MAWCEEDDSADWCHPGLPTAAVIGITVAVIVVVAALGGLFVFFVVLRKKPEADE
jgi:hypothetical protein